MVIDRVHSGVFLLFILCFIIDYHIILIIHCAQHIIDMRGLAELVRVCKTYSDQRLLAAIAPIIIVVMPSPEELKKFRDDEFVHPVDQVELLPVLKKIRLNGYGHLAVVPNWIDTAIALMVFTTDGKCSALFTL